MALQGGEPGDPSPVPIGYTPDETGSRLRVGGTSVLGCPTGETVGNRKRERLTSFAADAKPAAHGGAPPTTKKNLQIGAEERRVVPTEHGVEATADVATEEREQADAASAEGGAVRGTAQSRAEGCGLRYLGREGDGGG